MTPHAPNACPPLDFTALRVHAAEIRAQELAREAGDLPPLDLTPTAHRRLQQYLERYGEDKLIRLVDMADMPLGASSEAALDTVQTYIARQLQVALLVKYDPRNKNPERQAECRAITGGGINLAMDLGRVS